MLSQTPMNRAPMDCKSFRKQHLAYLDDTMPGDDMTRAQHHVMVCDGCAAHDTLVRRSLMVARSLPTVTPSVEFQARLRARLAECRDESRTAQAAGTAFPRHWGADPTRPLPAPDGRRITSRLMVAAAAGAMLGAYAWRGWGVPPASTLSIQPVIASQPAMPTPAPYITPELMQAMSTGNPVWPAALLIEDAPPHYMHPDFTLTTFSVAR
ncbi:MAG: hypothetical protein P3B76_01940 [Gemmatimonadota bacterium]|jgi:hypothetical protein|nr:hypothetical protein [Gemmatimonadota bacterium]MDQ8166696.1 hypothetical protein [Gemmatimonadota bacterium]MDQ8171422.1 hypothetical protein [Gemmatimonadota bacterium]